MSISRPVYDWEFADKEKKKEDKLERISRGNGVMCTLIQCRDAPRFGEPTPYCYHCGFNEEVAERRRKIPLQLDPDGYRRMHVGIPINFRKNQNEGDLEDESV